MNLDLRSFLALSTAMMVVMAVMFGLLRRSLPKGSPGLGHWTLGLVVLVLAGGLLAARGVLPDAVSVLAGNTALLAGTLWLLVGVRVFYGAPLRLMPWLGLIAATTVALHVTLFFQPLPGARTAIVCVVWAALLFQMARTIWRHDRLRFGARFTIAVLAAHSVLVALRAASALISQANTDLLHPTPMQTVYLLANASMTLALPFGLVLMSLERLRDEIEFRATHDALTGVLSRAPIIDLVDAEMHRSRRVGRPMCVCMIDIDHFKSVNDTHGHLVGDQALIAFTQRVSSVLRPYDRIGRYGGEEFLLLFPDADAAAAHSVIERVRAAVAVENAPLPRLTASAGLTEIRPTDASVDALLGRADAALYLAKAGGRDRVLTG
jgi:diguanylate cyclase (GGDEF)-like protein